MALGREKLAARKARLARRQRFLKARLAEAAFSRHLKAAARQVGAIVKGFSSPEGEVENLPALTQALQDYSVTLRPWARAVTQRMHTEVEARNAKAWEELAREMGGTLRRQLAKDPTGAYMRSALNLQIDLITSIPLAASERVHVLAMRNLTGGGRGENIREMLLAQTRVSVSKAKEIARTETARTAALLTEGRALSIGSVEYIWRTAGDSDVRKIHRHLEGKTFRWDAPPVSGESGERSNPGCIYNCRCYAEPVLPDSLFGIGGRIAA